MNASVTYTLQTRERKRLVCPEADPVGDGRPGMPHGLRCAISLYASPWGGRRTTRDGVSDRHPDLRPTFQWAMPDRRNLSLLTFFLFFLAWLTRRGRMVPT